MKKSDDVRKEAVRTVLFVFVLFSVAEITAPYFKVTFTDPLLLTTFITGAIGAVIGNMNRKCEHAHGVVLVVKDSYFPEFCEKLGNCPDSFTTIKVAETADDAIKVIKNEPQPKLKLITKIKEMISAK